jgi:AcrR family transcriptional regulator
MKERIVEAALECFRRMGVDETRMEDIADEAGLQRPNLYRYFPNKAAVIREAIIQEMHATHALRRKKVKLDGPVGPLLVDSVAIGLELARKNETITFNLSPGAVDITVDMLSGDPDVMAAQLEYWGPLLHHGRERGEIRKDLDDEKIVRWLLNNQFLYLERPQLFQGLKIRTWIQELVVPAVLSPRGLSGLS